MDNIYEYNLFDFDIFITSNIENINVSIMAIFPTSVRFNVKNSRHHKIFNTPFIINSTIVDVGISDFDTHIDSTMP